MFRYVEPSRRHRRGTARTDARFREANEKIQAVAAEYGVDCPIPFICECIDPGCHRIMRMSLDEYAEVRSHPRQFLNAPGHQAAAAGDIDVIAELAGYVIVESRSAV